MSIKTKGIILAGGSGTRLYPLTTAVNKQLLPVYDKPMIFYPLSILMLAEIKDILIISTPEYLPNFKKLFGNGSSLGIKLSYKEQPKPEGLAQAFIIGEEFIGKDNVAMILGDNIFYGNGLTKLLKEARNKKTGATIFSYYVNNPERFGVAGFNKKGEVTSIEEKPKNPKSNYAVTGLYFYDNRVINFAKKLKPSSRGELEITDINKLYLKQKELNVQIMGRGYAWLDTGTIDSLTEAGEFIKVIEDRQNIKIAALEEIAFNNGWITKNEIKKVIQKYGNSKYAQHLIKVVEGAIKHIKN
jgi:glucose-1-phosphate thymidylyltransferase